MNNDKTADTRELSESQSPSQPLSKNTLVVLATSSVLTLIASQLLQGSRLGLDFILLVMCSLTAFYCLRLYTKLPLTNIEKGLVAAGAGFTCLLVFRDSLVLYWLNILGIFTVLSLAFAQRLGGDIRHIHAWAWFKVPFHFITLVCVSCIKLFSFTCNIPFAGMQDTYRLRSVAMGLVWVLPIVFVLGSLLISADVRFGNFAREVFSIDLSGLWSTLLEYLIYWPFLATFLYATVLGPVVDKDSEAKSILRLDGAQLLTMLVSVNALFFCYIVVQFGYFFGGDQLVAESDGLTYSAYARSGFWELIWLAIISLSLLLVGHWLQRDESKTMKLWFNRLATIMIVAVVIMEFSAVHRMVIYVKMYGLTELRFYSSIFMLYIIFALVTFYMTVLRGNRGRLIFNMVAQAMVFVAVLNIVNPDARIAQYNLNHNEVLDSEYLRNLSADAYVSIYQGREVFPSQIDCSVQEKMSRNLPANNRWYEWNWSESRAQGAIHNWGKECNGYIK